MNVMGTCPNAGCSPTSPCESCQRKQALEKMGEMAATNPEMMANLDLDAVFENAVIKGMMAITWKNEKGEVVSRGLPKAAAQDFWRAYAGAKKEGMQKIAEVIAKQMGMGQILNEEAPSIAPDVVTKPVSETEAPPEPIPVPTVTVEGVPRPNAKEKRKLSRSKKRVGTNGTNGSVSEDSDSSSVEESTSEHKAAH